MKVISQLKFGGWLIYRYRMFFTAYPLFIAE